MQQTPQLARLGMQSLDSRPMHEVGALVVGIIGFLTLVDLFAAQAILPSLVRAYHVTPAAMGFAVNASTIGMALSALFVGLVSHRINRRLGIWLSLALLSIPTTLLAFAPDLPAFTLLRITQGIFMSAAFTLTIAYAGERLSPQQTAVALAAYITGGVASNLVGRLIAAGVVSTFGLSANFFVFAALNLLGAFLVYVSLSSMDPMVESAAGARSPFAAWGGHLRHPRLRASFGIGYLILFVFIGAFTYINFVLVSEPLNLSTMTLGVVYLVFLPSMFTTPLAGRAALRFGTAPVLWASLAIAAMGLPLVLAKSVPLVLAGLVLLGVGTFFAQAAATGFVGRTAMTDRAAASGLYLACYYLGGLSGAAIIGQIFDRLGWGPAVFGLAAALGLAAVLTVQLRERHAALAERRRP